MTKQVMKPRRKAKLPQAPPMESRHKRTLIVVADGARARFFEPRHDTHTLVPARPGRHGRAAKPAAEPGDRF
jgi:hypothetical protein